MTRGSSLEQDLRLLVNNPKYSDVEILCEDEKKLYGCRAILAARSEVFDRLFYNGMKESYENKISFPEINSSGMEIILEYAYTGSIKEGSLIEDNIVEAFYAADYFQLPDLQGFIVKTVKDTLEKNHTENYSPELLSKVVETMPLSEDNVLLGLLVEAVAIMPLNTVEFDRLSIAALQYLLVYTHEKEKLFATPEYEVFRYSAILAAKQVSNETYEIFVNHLPTLENVENSIRVKNEFITGNRKVVKELEPLIKFIDFRRINGQILVDIIEPLEIVPAEIILNVYRHKTKSNNSDLNDIRGIPIYNDLIWDESACGSGLIVEENGKVIRASGDCDGVPCARAKMILNNNGIYEWDVIVEKARSNIYVGVCASENFDYQKFAGNQPTGWVLGSNGSYCNSGNWMHNYCSSFYNDAIITVHLNMNKRSIAFTVNGTRHPEVSEWNNLPSKLYPVVSLWSHSRLRIQSHGKSNTDNKFILGNGNHC